MAKKKSTRKPASATALPQGNDIPEGFKQVGGGYAPTWKPETGESLKGVATSVKEVEMTIGRKKQTRRCVEVTDTDTGKRFAIWESAALGDWFDQLAESGEGTEVFIRFDGLGKAKKAGQNPPKLFTAAVAA